MIIKKLPKLLFGIRETVGRSHGRIAAPRRSSLTKRLYRFLDTKRIIFPGEILKIVKRYLYDPNRTGFISLIMSPNGTFFYILAVAYLSRQPITHNLKKPDKRFYDKYKGYSEILHNFGKGSILTGVGFTGFSAGCASVLLSSLAFDRSRYSVRLSSGEYRLFLGYTMAIFGCVSNGKHFIRKFHKAGDTRLRGFRPRVRPSAMNPVDHPMGGRTKGGCAPCSRSGLLSLGTSTVIYKHKLHNHVIVTPARRVRLKKLKKIKKV